VDPPASADGVDNDPAAVRRSRVGLLSGSVGSVTILLVRIGNEIVPG